MVYLPRIICKRACANCCVLLFLAKLLFVSLCSWDVHPIVKIIWNKKLRCIYQDGGTVQKSVLRTSSSSLFMSPYRYGLTCFQSNHCFLLFREGCDFDLFIGCRLLCWALLQLAVLWWRGNCSAFYITYYLV